MGMAHKHLHPAFDAVAGRVVQDAFVGTWKSTCASDVDASITIAVQDGSLYVTEYTYNDTDVLQVITQNPDTKQLPLWRVRGDEDFR